MMKQNLDNLKSQLIPLYEALRNDCNASDNLTPFIMQWGDKFPTNPNEGIIFYGRATNGWGHGTWDYDIFFSDDSKDECRGWARDDQMVWVEKQWSASEDTYVTRRSQFWSVIKGVSVKYYGEEWYKYVAWSNLCKVAPSAEGNPSDPLFYGTLPNNLKVFSTELDFWSPKYVVLLTDGLSRDGETTIDWTSDYISAMNDGTLPPVICEKAWDDENPNIKTKVYKIGERYFILSLHPQGRKVESHTNAIIEIIESIERDRIWI